MADDITISVELEVDERGFIKDFNKLKGKIKRPARKAGENAGDSFDKGFKARANKLGQSISALKSTFFGVTAAIAAVGFTTSKAVQAAIRQENAVNQLNTALKINGNFTRETSKDLQNFASELQKTTKFGDEAVLEQLKLAQAFGANVEQSKAAVKAATDLATAFGIDLQSATRNVSKTLGGYAGELGEVIPELKSLSQEQLKAGAGIDLIAKKFEGFAEKSAKSFSGSLTQASNAFDDLLEGFGRLITETPASGSIVNALKEAFEGATAAIDDFRISLNQNDAEEQAKRIRQIKVEVIDLEQANLRAQKTVDTAFRPGAVLEGIRQRNERIVELNAELKKLIVTQKAQEEQEKKNAEAENQTTESTKRKTRAAALTNQQILTELGAAGIARLQLLEQQQQQELDLITEAASRKIISEQEFQAAKTQLEINEENKRNQILNEIRQGQQDQTFSVTEAFAEGFISSTDTANEGLKKFAQNARQQGKAFRDGIGQGVGQGFAAFGRALATGENAFDAFAKSFLGTLGQLMVQQGTAFILQGLGFKVIPGLQGSGASLVATGSALAVFGGALSALSGGGGAAAASGAGAAAAGGEPVGQPTETVTAQATEREEPQTAVSVVVNGDVFDSQETGTRIAQILSDSFQQEGIVISNGSFA